MADVERITLRSFLPEKDDKAALRAAELALCASAIALGLTPAHVNLLEGLEEVGAMIESEFVNLAIG